MNKKPKIVLTGGHLSPLLAVLEALEKKADCMVVGRKYAFEGDKTVSLEYKVMQELGISFYPFSAGRFQRRLSKNTIPSLLKSPVSFLKARKLLKKLQPDVVVTFGGYIGVPVSLAAYSLQIPVVLHEQTQKAGLANKFIGRFASKVCISYSSSRAFFPHDKTVLTGNPVRKEVFTVDAVFDIPKDMPVLFVTGGSTGAHTINTYIEYLLPKLLQKFVVIHQTGDSEQFQDYAHLLKLKETLPAVLKKRYILKQFILPSEIGFVYKKADVVLCRSGANTISELLALSKKALVVPLPHGQSNEQLENAKLYESSGLGIYKEEKDIRLENLLKNLEDLLDIQIVQKKEKSLEDPAEKIADIVLSFTHDEY